jgi:tetratricopeptide (TPR) repeat protein
MHHSSLFAVLAGIAVFLVQPVATAKSAFEVKEIAQAVTVEIKLQINRSAGSGVIINRKGNLYTIVTNQHVVCGIGRCSELPLGEVYSLGLPDGQKHRFKGSSIKLLGKDLDLAIIQFRSNFNYAVAKVASPENLKAKDNVYTAGFPSQQSGFSFNDGNAIAVVVNKRLLKDGDRGGYTVIYDAHTLPGMSGSGVFDKNGQLVAIHGQGDKYKKNTDIGNDSRIGTKIGYNRGISVRWLVEGLAEIGINLDGRNSFSTKDISLKSQITKDDYFIAGFNKFVEPGDNVIAGKIQAIRNFSWAIKLDPQYDYAYFMRADAYEQVQDFQKSLSDYDRAIMISPKFLLAYYNRATLKGYKLNDIRGALADCNQAIMIEPKNAYTYNNCGSLKEDINDIRGALADYSQAIVVNPKLSEAYNNRALLKEEKLRDSEGALADYSQAIVVNSKFSIAYYNRGSLKTFKFDDFKGALADFNQAILINSEYSEAYGNRGFLKAYKLADREGGIQDLRKAAEIFKEQKKEDSYRQVFQMLKDLGAAG